MAEKGRYAFTLTKEPTEWVSSWLKAHGAPAVMLSSMIDDYIKGIQYTLMELDKSGGNPTVGDLFRITGEALNNLKEPPLL